MRCDELLSSQSNFRDPFVWGRFTGIPVSGVSASRGAIV
jgi:hypothetical protein